MKIVECRGSNRKIGQTIGESLRDEIQAHIAGFLPEDLTSLEQETAYLKASLAKFCPGVLEQMLAAASAADVTELQMLAMNAPSGRPDCRYEQGCSNIAFASGPDGPIWGKNNEGRFPPPANKPVVNAQGPRPVCALKL